MYKYTGMQDREIMNEEEGKKEWGWDNGIQRERWA